MIFWSFLKCSSMRALVSRYYIRPGRRQSCLPLEEETAQRGCTEAGLYVAADRHNCSASWGKFYREGGDKKPCRFKGMVLRMKCTVLDFNSWKCQCECCTLYTVRFFLSSTSLNYFWVVFPWNSLIFFSLWLFFPSTFNFVEQLYLFAAMSRLASVCSI